MLGQTHTNTHRYAHTHAQIRTQAKKKQNKHTLWRSYSPVAFRLFFYCLHVYHLAAALVKYMAGVISVSPTDVDGNVGEHSGRRGHEWDCGNSELTSGPGCHWSVESRLRKPRLLFMTSTATTNTQRLDKTGWVFPPWTWKPNGGGDEI